MGHLFERQVENLARQFRGQVVPGRLFGLDEDVTLPTTRSVEGIREDDPSGQYGSGPDSHELDLVVTGEAGSEIWAVECKHRRGALTRPMVERFLQSARAIERARGVHFARLWIVAPRGIRPDANQVATEEGILRSGRRQLETLARSLNGPLNEAHQARNRT
jgi:hypothetical protein